ncbi:hypothetical protein GLS40_04675 [Pseudooceanicola sp. 216_PA32_1]|uniref:Polyketide cyclase / dehydrase and lipid transport n=1 Tax=Pseudooceanicola pacificus TaxID=2676438 RepID=A0A844W3B2_9RHOB|nr:hypothetical protein [Pseudooceanicola pacificus]MWB77311.1 hypothetical protein [Pseudooceanicola pacificus]
MLKKSMTALGLVFAMTAPGFAYTGDSLPVEDVTVRYFEDSAYTIDASKKYPGIVSDLTAAVRDALPNLVEGEPGYDVNIKVYGLSLTGGPISEEGKDFNSLEAMVEVNNPQLGTVTHSFPVVLKAHSGDAMPGVLTVSPNSDDYYDAMLLAFADGVKRELDGVLADVPADQRK